MLFTQTFLSSHMKPDAAALKDCGRVFLKVFSLWQKASEEGVNWSEEETEKNFVQPVLELLNWSFAVQVKVRNIGDVTRPDYTLFMDAMSRALAEAKGEGSHEFYKRAFVVAEAKHWKRTLDSRGETQRDSWKALANPDHQMIGYLKTSGVRWGVLTNGALWRLYYQPRSSSVTDFIEINLEDIYRDAIPGSSVRKEQLLRFYIWWRLFHRDAFIPEGTGFAYIDQLYESSIGYRQAIVKRLINRILDEAVPTIAEGLLFVRYQKWGRGPEAKIDIDSLTTLTVNLIYRMLFMFVAEYKGMLPSDAYGNQVIGLCALTNRLLDKKHPVQDIYLKLLELFNTLYYGDRASHIPPYRGDLFDPNNAENKLMAQHVIPDSHISKVIHALIMDGDRVVDYACIESEQLSAIAEVLLEIKIHFVELPLGRRELRAKVMSSVKETTSESEITIHDPSIDYVVEQAMYDLLKRNEEIFTRAMDAIVLARTEHNDMHKVDISPKIDELSEHILKAWLGNRILDPAMGTGRCLIGAVNHLTHEIISRMQVYHDLNPDVPWEWNPLYGMLEQERKRSQARMSRYGLVVKSAVFGDTQLLKRLITTRCIYGVEDSSQGVMMGKHNLWLSSLSIGAPFTFLDYHIRQGDSIVGTLLRDDYDTDRANLREYLVSYADRVLSRSQPVRPEFLPVAWTSKAYESFKKGLSTFKHALSTHIMKQMGDPQAEQLLQRYGADIQGLRDDARSRQVANQHQFFHWDLEFPDIFVCDTTHPDQGTMGFDVVLSIPKRWKSIKLNETTLQFVKIHFPGIDTLENAKWYYFAQGLRLLHATGFIAVSVDQRVFLTHAGSLPLALQRIKGDAVI